MIGDIISEKWTKQFHDARQNMIFLMNVKIDVLELRLALLLFCRRRAEATGVHLCGLDQLWGRLEAAGVEALLRCAPLRRTEDRGRTQRTLLQADPQR